MRRFIRLSVLVAAAFSTACASSRAGTAPDGDARARSDTGDVAMKPYSEVVTTGAVSDSGLFVTHQINTQLLFEIPDEMLDREMIIVSRRARTAEDLGYGGEKNNTQTVRWQRVEEWLMGEDAESEDLDVSQSDIVAVARGELEALRRDVAGAIGRAPDRATRLHLRDVRARIDDTLNPHD